MRITVMPMITMIFSTVLHIFLAWLFIYVYEMDIIGLAIASSIKDGMLMTSTMVCGSFDSKINIALVPITMDAFTGWREYLKISLPTTLMICAEWWAFEILTILAGILGV